MPVRVTAVVPAEPDAVWQRWTDFARWPEWNKQCVAACLEGPLQPGSKLDMQLRHPSGRDLYTRPVITAVQHGSSIGWEARGLLVRAPLASTLIPERDGTRLTVELNATGRLAMTYRMALSESAQAQLWTAALQGLSGSFGEAAYG